MIYIFEICYSNPFWAKTHDPIFEGLERTLCTLNLDRVVRTNKINPSKYSFLFENNKYKISATMKTVPFRTALLKF